MISAGSVKSAAKHAGADLVGIASTDRFKQYPEEKRPEHLLPEAKSVIVVGVRVLLDTVKPNLLLSALHHITLNLYHNQIAGNLQRKKQRNYAASMPGVHQSMPRKSPF